MKTIHKYAVPYGLVGAERDTLMPEGAQLLTVQMQHGSPVVWAIVDPAARAVRRSLVIFGTGQPLPDLVGRPHDPRPPMVYIGTFQDGPYVWHVFEITDYSAC